MLRGMVRCSNESANGFVIADTICETRRSKRIDLRIESYSQQGTSWGRMRTNHSATGTKPGGISCCPTLDFTKS